MTQSGPQHPKTYLVARRWPNGVICPRCGNAKVYKLASDGRPGGTASGKAIVVGAVRRKGNVVARVIQNVSAVTLEAFVNEAVSNRVSLLCTDQWTGYRNLKKTFPHVAIDHSRKQYVVGAVHTNTIEGFWSISSARYRRHFPQR